MVATLLAAIAGGVVAAIVALGGVAAMQPDVQPQVSQGDMVKYGDDGHL